MIDRARSLRLVGLAAAILGPTADLRAEPPTVEEVTQLEADLDLESVKVLVRQREYAAAESRARAILKAAREEYGADSLAEALALDAVVGALSDGGKANTDECLELALESVRIRESIFGNDHVVVARARARLGFIDYQRSLESESRENFERALVILERDLGEDHPSTMWTRLRLATLYRDMELFDEALRLSQRDLEIRERKLGPEHEDLAGGLYTLGGILRRMRRWEESERAYSRAMSILETKKGPDHLLVAYSANGLGNLYDDIGDYHRARESYERALSIAEDTLGRDHPFTVTCLNNLGYLFRNLGDYESAIARFDEVLAVRERVLAPNHEHIAATLSNLSAVYFLSGRLDESEAAARRALSICRKALGEDSYETSTCLVRLADVASERGEHARAREDLQNAVEIRRNTLGPRAFETAELEARLGRAHLSGGDLDTARALLEHALERIEDSVGEDHPRNAEILRDLAIVHFRGGEIGRALETALRAEELARRHARLTVAYLPERQALRFASVRTDGLDLALSLASEDASGAGATWDSLIRSRALVKDEMVRRQRRVNAETEGGSPEQITYRHASRELASLLVRGPDRGDAEGYRDRIRRAREERERAERELAKQSAVYRMSRASGTTGLAEATAALPPRSALVAYVRYARIGTEDQDDHYAGFVMKHGETETRFVSLGEARGIDSLVRAWRVEVSRPPLTPEADLAQRQAGAPLRGRVWDPLVPLLEGADRIFIVPDDALHLVNFAALPTDEGYLLETGRRFHYLSSERDLVPTDRPPFGSGILLVGAPAFDDAVGSSADAAGRRPGFLHDHRFGPLPQSEREVTEIAALWSATQGGDAEARVLTGAQATEGRVKELVPGRRVVHLATHGFFLDGPPVPASPNTRGIGGLAASAPPPESPLRLSGLALAGANVGSEGEEDGVLTAEEIAALDLSSIDWVVLSACDTGIGAIQSGEGVLGLRRAFEVAGAGTLLMTLWAVEDESARRWMEELYRAHWADSLSTIDAVHRASVAVLEERRRRARSHHPFYWGAFVAAGRWR